MNKYKKLSRSEIVSFKTDLLLIKSRLHDETDNEVYFTMLNVCDTAIDLFDRLEELKNDGSKYL